MEVKTHLAPFATSKHGSESRVVVVGVMRVKLCEVALQFKLRECPDSCVRCFDPNSAPLSQSYSQLLPPFPARKDLARS